MSKYLIYSKPNCTYCVQAKNLLKERKLPFDEIVLDVGQDKEGGVTYLAVESFKKNNPTVRTMPYIIGPNDEVIGGYQQLATSLN